MKIIINNLKKLKDNQYATFQSRLIPTINKKTIIGIRTPELKKLAKEMAWIINFDKKNTTKVTKFTTKDVEQFLSELPHKYFDEMQLHAFIISEIKDFKSCINYVEKFLPYIDNWATCDQLSPKVFAKHKDELLQHIKKWVKSKKTYIIRFGIVMLMRYYLDDDFDNDYLDIVINAGENAKCNNKTSKLCRRGKAMQVCKDNKLEKIDIDTNPNKYYIEMAKAWFFATALAKQYDATFPIIKSHKLLNWTHNKTIQKAKESFRVSGAHRIELNKYIIKK